MYYLSTHATLLEMLNNEHARTTLDCHGAFIFYLLELT